MKIGRRPAKSSKTRSPRSRKSAAKSPIQVKLNSTPAVLQPNETFRVCPLGLQFYSPKKLPDFRVMDFRMQVAPGTGGAEDVSCSGVVVHCQKEKDSGLYRVWVKFLDLAEDKSARLQCAAKNADAICPHCENF